MQKKAHLTVTSEEYTQNRCEKLTRKKSTCEHLLYEFETYLCLSNPSASRPIPQKRHEHLDICLLVTRWVNIISKLSSTTSNRPVKNGLELGFWTTVYDRENPMNLVSWINALSSTTCRRRFGIACRYCNGASFSLWFPSSWASSCESASRVC